MVAKRVCQVPLCGNFKFFTQKSDRDDLHFFNIPKDRLVPWTEAIGRPEIALKHSNHHLICSDHFREEDYIPNVLNTEFNQNYKRRLKSDAVPSLLLPTPEQILKINAEKKEREKKLIKRRKRITPKLNVKKKEDHALPETQQQPQPIFPNNTCLVCSEEMSSSSAVTPAPLNYQLAGSCQSTLLNEQLWSTFILRKIIQLPVWKFEELLNTTGLSVNPGKWFVLCDTCTQTVKNIMEIQDNVYKLELKVKELLNGMKVKFERSLESNRGYDRDEIGEMDVTMEIRRFFKKFSAGPKVEVGMAAQDKNNDIDDDIPSNLDEGDKEDIKVESENEEEMTEPSSDGDENYQDAEDEDWIPTPTTQLAEKPGDVVEMDPLADEHKDGITIPEFKLVESTTKFRKGLPERVYKCEWCPREYFTLSLIKNHYELHSRIRRTGNGRNECCRCGIPFEKAKTLRAHLQMEHQIRLDASWDDTNESQEDHILRMGLQGDEEEEDNFKCKLCPRMYSVDHLYRQHMELHDKSKQLDNGRYDCSVCGVPYLNAVSVQSHIMDEHGMTLHQMWDKSGEPQSEFLYTGKTKKNVAARLKEKGYDISGVVGRPKGPRVLKAKYQCPICPRKLTKQGYLDKHIEYHELTKRKFKGRFDCARCGVPFASLNNLRIHYRDQHKLFLDRKWNGDGESRQEDFLTALDAPRPPPPPPPKPKQKDKIPENSTVSDGNDYDGAKLKCPKCDLYCKNQVGLKNHLKKKHEMKDTPVVCELCGFVVDSNQKRQEIEAHMLTHKIYDNSVDPSISTTDFICNLCNKLFSNRRDLRSHKLSTHAEELGLTVYKCSYCPKVFPRNHNRMFHELRIHKKKGLYPCTHCDYEAISRISLEIHMSKHAKSKHVCEYCSATYKYTNAFRDHMRRYHPDKWVSAKRLKFTGVPVETLASIEGDQPLLSISLRKKQIKADKEVKCKYCDALLPHPLGLKMHLEEIHKDMYKYNCDLCERVYMSVASLNLHKKINHKEKDQKVRCGWCFKLVAHRISLYDHRKRCPKRPKETDGQVVPKIMPVDEQIGEMEEQVDN